jgi:predicted ATPase/transcriptional regulator with XRE-family HTH domain
MGFTARARRQPLVKPPLAGVAFDDEVEGFEFTALLKHWRVRAGLSQQALAERALISVQAVSALERGYRKAPYRETLERLADALRLPAHARASLEEAARRARGSRFGARKVGRAHNLPRQLTSFLGREDAVTEIASLACTSPLVSIVATGGAGKTRAAVEVGGRLLTRFPDGVWFVELAPLNDPALVTNALAGVLGVQESPRRSLLETLISYLEQKHLLIVLDNCEHVIAQVRTVVGSLLRECSMVSVVATSREPLGIAGERVYRMPPLAVPQQKRISPTDAMSYGAVALFVDRARAADTRFAITQENVEAVVDICRRLDGLPLAIELAAARATILSPRQISERLERIFDVPSAEAHRVLPRHQTMQAVIDWSYALLSSQAQLLFDRLSTFAGGFTLESATAVCADGALVRRDVLELLTSLVTRSLVMVDFSRGAARYHLLEATRQYALERLAERGERQRLAQRHALACLISMERLDRAWYVADERSWFAEAEAELDNCRAALGWSLSECGDVRIGRRLAAALARVWYSLSPVEGRRWVRFAIESIDAETRPTVVSQLHIVDAELSGALGEYQAALAAARRAQAAFVEAPDALQQARLHQNLGSALGATGRGPEGNALLDEALAIARRLNNRRLQALILGDIGTAHSRRGDVAGARPFYAEALASYVSLGLERPAASIAGHLAEVEFAAGDPAAALLRAEEALRGHETTRNRRSVANDLSNMAAYLVSLDRYDEAWDYASQALDAARDVKATVLTAYIVQHVAAIEALRRDADERGRERAAMLAGFVDARLKSLDARREFTEQQEYERMLSALRGNFGNDKLHGLMTLGAEWAENRAVAVALEP